MDSRSWIIIAEWECDITGIIEWQGYGYTVDLPEKILQGKICSQTWV